MALQNIRAVDVHSQRRKPPMLVVSFVNEDQVIFTSTNPQSWKRMIDETIQGTNMNYFIYTSHHFTAREDMNSTN